MNRSDLQTLSNLRLEEAHALFKAGHPSGAYYLAGYSIECALKAVIARSTSEFEFPDKQRATDSFIHDPRRLMKVAKLTERFQADILSRPALSNNWVAVAEWSEASRYNVYSEIQAKVILFAVGEKENGVLPWITQYW